MKITTKRYYSPCGVLLLGSCGHGLCLCDWLTDPAACAPDRPRRPVRDCEYEEGDSLMIERAVRQLDEYFSGNRREFDIPLLSIGTDFQKRVRDALLSIPYGRTVTYSDIARKTGHPEAVRAVANAIAANPISIIVPCHRVIGLNGKLTGYAGGLPAKEYLLTLERSPLPAPHPR